MLDLREDELGVTLKVRVKTRASREAIVGVREGALEVRLSAPPLEGQANAALLRLLAGWLRLPPSAIVIVKGGKTRNKLVRVSGISAAGLGALVEGGAH